MTAIAIPTDTLPYSNSRTIKAETANTYGGIRQQLYLHTIPQCFRILREDSKNLKTIITYYDRK